MRSDVFTAADAVTNSAMTVDRNGKIVPALFMTKTCYFNELALLRAEMQSLEPQHQEQNLFSRLGTIYGSATTATIEAGGLGLTVRITVKSAATTWVSTFCNAAAACFRLVCAADATACDNVKS